MNYLDLFHGIGGFALGAYMAGMKFQNHYCSDIVPYCQKLYTLRFPDSIQLGDITKIDTKKLPVGEWIISGGFPCQDISIAGKGEGIGGKRSGLWFEYWRIISELRPRFAIMENVGALTFRGLDQVLGALAEIGYNAEWQDIRASDVGAPHKRERIWIVAYPDTERESQQKGIKQEKRGRPIYKSEDVANSCGSGGKKSKRTGRQAGNRSGNKSEKLSNSDSTGRDTDNRRKEQGRGAKLTGSSWWETDPADLPDTDGDKQHRRVGNVQVGRSWSQEDVKKGVNEKGNQWGFKSYVGRVANGIPGRVDRLKGLGNSIVPQIAAILFERIKEMIEYKGKP